MASADFGYQTEKSIELEYKQQPELPILQHQAALHITDFMEQRFKEWNNPAKKDGDQIGRENDKMEL